MRPQTKRRAPWVVGSILLGLAAIVVTPFACARPRVGIAGAIPLESGEMAGIRAEGESGELIIINRGPGVVRLSASGEDLRLGADDSWSGRIDESSSVVVANDSARGATIAFRGTGASPFRVGSDLPRPIGSPDPLEPR